MCKNGADARASQPQRRSAVKPSPSATPTASSSAVAASAASAGSTSSSTINTSNSNGGDRQSPPSSWSLSSLASLHASLPPSPALFSPAEIAAAAGSPLSTLLSPSSCRCSLRGRDSFVLRRPFRGDPSSLPSLLAAACKSHHRSLIRLIGASLSYDDIHLVYDFAPGASLASCLRNPRNPNFTLLSSWVSRMQVAADLAQGLEYIHHHSAGGGTVHNRIKSSAVIVSETNFNAKICHFGAAILAGEVSAGPSVNKMRRADSLSVKIEGTRGYLAPEVIAGGGVSSKSDVYAFGVVLLELICGEEPLKLRLDGMGKKYEWISMIETARWVVGASGWEEAGLPVAEAEERAGRLRRWVDPRLRDSFPVEVAEKLTLVALRCVEKEAARRPGMNWVVGKISQLFLESKAWSERVRVPADISVSFAPR